MAVFLDTSIQVDRILGSRRRKDRIASLLGDEELCTAAYVKGEYYATVVKDAVTAANLVLQHDDIYEMEKRLNERSFYRSQSRIHRIIIAFRQSCGDDIELMKIRIPVFIHQLQQQFEADLVDIVDHTRCARAKASIFYNVDGIDIKGTSCNKKNAKCDIVAFWNDFRDKLDLDEDMGQIPSSMRAVLPSVLAGKRNDRKGNNCRCVGDCIICIEASTTDDKQICSTNKQDFEGFCQIMGLELLCPDYSE